MRGAAARTRPNLLRRADWRRATPQVFQPESLSSEEMTFFHSDEYVEFLRLITPDNQARAQTRTRLLRARR